MGVLLSSTILSHSWRVWAGRCGGPWGSPGTASPCTLLLCHSWERKNIKTITKISIEIVMFLLNVENLIDKAKFLSNHLWCYFKKGTRLLVKIAVGIVFQSRLGCFCNKDWQWTICVILCISCPLNKNDIVSRTIRRKLNANMPWTCTLGVSWTHKTFSCDLWRKNNLEATPFWGMGEG